MTTTRFARVARYAIVILAGGLAARGMPAATAAQAPAGSSPSARTDAPAQPVAIVALDDRAGDADRQLIALERQGSLRLRSSRADTMIEGRIDDRFDQYVGDARVFGAQIVRQRSAEGVLSVFGRTYPDVPLDLPAPRLGPEGAAARALAITGHPPLASHDAELVLLPLDDGSFRLTWYLRVLTGRDLVALFVDAGTGDEVFRYSDLQTQTQAGTVGTGTGVLGDRKKISVRPGTGLFLADDSLRPPSLVTYDMKGDVTRVNRVLDGLTSIAQSDVASDTDNAWTDGAIVDAHVYVGYTYDYYFKRFNRRGLDDNNTRIRSMVHPASRSQLPFYDEYTIFTFMLNAFWCGGCGSDRQSFMVFGEGLPPGFYLIGSGQTVTYFSASLDIVAHELSHGVTQYTSNLIYRNESGALNEAFSDVMGVGTDFYFTAQGAKPTPANYVVGEETFIPFLPGSVAGLRSLSDPGAFGDPDHNSQRYTGTEDNGGVHINSTIVGHAFYLAIEGGTNRTSGLSVQGVGGANREQVERVFYRAFTQYLPANATFAIARQATLRAATDLYGGSSAAFRAVSQAWDAVGVQ
jgi:Zn-dependent metalloprotease